MKTKTQTVDLSNIKYAIAITGGGWSYEHTLYLVMNNGDAYITKDWKAKDIVPSNKVEAYHIGKLDVSKDFVVPSKLVTNCCDFCRVEVFDNTLSRAIYDAYGLEDEYSNYFGNLRKMSYDIELELKREEFRNYHQQREKERKLILKNENAYSNGKKMTADEFFAMSGMLLDNMDAPEDMEK